MDSFCIPLLSWCGKNAIMFLMLNVGAILACLGWFLVYRLRALVAQSKHAQPGRLPGPRTYPIVGRVHDLPDHAAWLYFAKLGQQFGPICQTKILSNHFVIISTEKVAKDLLSNRADIYSDRPPFKSIYDSKSEAGGMDHLPLMGIGKIWNRQRRYAITRLVESSKSQYHGVPFGEMEVMLARLAREPDRMFDISEDYGGRTIARICWDDPSLVPTLRIINTPLITQLSPSGTITNRLTFLWDIIPEMINPFKQAELKRRAERRGFHVNMFNSVKARLAAGTLGPCWTRSYLENKTSSGLSGDNEAALAIGNMAIIGTQTISPSIQWFCFIMIHFPKWQKAIQEEMQEAIGDKIPELEDSPKLPILRAVIREIFRWRPMIPTGVAHQLMQDDVYEGHLITKGTYILPLEWAFTRDTSKFPRPSEFLPERWLSPEYPTTFKAPLTQHPSIKGMTAFGWGRRVCLGQDYATTEIFVACAGVAWAFNLSLTPENDVAREMGEDFYSPVLIAQPLRFPAKWEIRSEEKRQKLDAVFRTYVEMEPCKGGPSFNYLKT